MNIWSHHYYISLLHHFNIMHLMFTFYTYYAYQNLWLELETLSFKTDLSYEKINLLHHKIFQYYSISQKPNQHIFICSIIFSKYSFTLWENADGYDQGRECEYFKTGDVWNWLTPDPLSITSCYIFYQFLAAASYKSCVRKESIEYVIKQIYIHDMHPGGLSA